MQKTIVLVDTFDGGHHFHYASVLASELYFRGWDIFVVGSGNLIASVKQVCTIRGAVELATLDIDAGEYSKYCYLNKALKAAISFRAHSIHILALDRMIGVLYLLLLRHGKIKQIFGTLHWGGMLLLGASGWKAKLKQSVIKILLLHLVNTKLTLMMHSKALVSTVKNANGKVGYVPYPHNSEIVGLDCFAKRVEMRAREMISDTDILLICFGGTRRDKGCDRAVRSLALLPQNFYLLVAGPEGEISKEELEEIAEKYGVLDRVRLHLSFIPDADVMQYFVASDVVLLPYNKSFSGQSGPLVSAASIGLPVVATPALVLQETIDEYGLGEVSENESDESIATAIQLVAGRFPFKQRSERFWRDHSGAEFASRVEQFYCQYEYKRNS